MRWFVEISTLGKKTSPSTTLCVEAPQWQPALQKARALRGDDGALTNFSIELLDDGYRAIDPAARLRYVVRKAPDDAVLTNGAGPSMAPKAAPRPAATTPPSTTSGRDGDPSKRRASAQTASFASPGAAAIAAPSPASSPPSGQDATSPTSGKRAAASTMAYSSTGAAAVRDDIAKAPAKPRPIIPSDAVPPRPQSGGAPLSYRVLHKREDEPSARSPLTYREVAYAIAEGTSPGIAGDFLRDRLKEIAKGLDPARRGKLVNLAAFDHDYQGRPQRPPVATLSWKEWKGEPELRFPLRDGPGNTPTPLALPADPDPSPAVAETHSTPPPAPEPAPVPAAAKVPSVPPREPDSQRRPAHSAQDGKAVRLAGDELLAELFEAFSDLHFLQDTLAGADFVLALTLEKLPSEVGVVSLFDINKREFVLVRQSGAPRSAVLARLSEKAPIAQAAMRSQRAIVVPDAASDKSAQDDRWKTMGIEPKSMVCAPVEVGGRYLGLIELCNPLDEQSFTDGDGHALTYIGQQFAEFVAAHGVITDPEQIMQGSKGHR